jgi:hypothetical protein
MHRDAPFILMVICFALVIVFTVAFFGCCQGCTPAGAASSGAHNADLGACFVSSRAYRDAGFDAEMAAWKECADRADDADRQRSTK